MQKFSAIFSMFVSMLALQSSLETVHFMSHAKSEWPRIWPFTNGNLIMVSDPKNRNFMSFMNEIGPELQVKVDVLKDII